MLYIFLPVYDIQDVFYLFMVESKFVILILDNANVLPTLNILYFG